MLFSKPLERGEAFGAACLLADAPPHAAALVALGEVQCLCLTAQSCADITTAFRPQLQRRSADLLERARGSKAASPLRPPPCRAPPHASRIPTATVDQTPYSHPRTPTHPPSLLDRSVSQVELDQLRWLRGLGLGSFGAVALVEHSPTGTPYALKTIGKRQAVQRGWLTQARGEDCLLS